MTQSSPARDRALNVGWRSVLDAVHSVNSISAWCTGSTNVVPARHGARIERAASARGCSSASSSSIIAPGEARARLAGAAQRAVVVPLAQHDARRCGRVRPSLPSVKPPITSWTRCAFLTLIQAPERLPASYVESTACRSTPSRPCWRVNSSICGAGADVRGRRRPGGAVELSSSSSRGGRCRQRRRAVALEEQQVEHVVGHGTGWRGPRDPARPAMLMRCWSRSKLGLPASSNATSSPSSRHSTMPSEAPSAAQLRVRRRSSRARSARAGERARPARRRGRGRRPT